MSATDPTEDLPLPQLWQRRFNDARNAQSPWREEARDAFDFYAGEQWIINGEDVKQQMNDQGKPALAFNRAGAIIDMVSGTEVNNRQEIRYLPRSLEDSGQADIMTAAVKYFREQSDAEDEESAAFHNMLVTGMGWIETYLDYEIDQDGMLMQAKRDPLAMYWDPNAEKDNIDDRRWQIYVKSISRQEFIDNWPDLLQDVIDSTRSFSNFDAEITSMQNRRQDYEVGGIGYDPESGNINVAQCQWYDLEDVYRVVNPQTGQIEKLEPAKMAKIRKFLDELGLPYVKMRQRHYKQRFIAGDVVLDEGDCPTQQGFSFTCMTAKRDRNAGCWYGLVRLMRDPQRWGNKWLSQVLHILNTNTKGGIIIEETATDDMEDVVEKMSASDSVVVVKEGGIAKIIPKPNTAMPQGFEKLSEFAMNSLPYVTGINPDMMGLAGRDQAAVLEAQRKQSGMTVLAPLFNSLRRYRKQQGRLMLDMVQKYVSDGRFIRIVGSEGAKYVTLVKQAGDLRFDCIVDDSPTSMNVKDKVWMIMSQAAPFLAKMGLMPPAEVLDYVDLPATLVDKWKESVRNAQPQGQQANPKDVAAAEKMKVETQGAQLDNALKQVELSQATGEMQSGVSKGAAKVLQEQLKTQGIAATAQASFARANAENLRTKIIPLQLAHDHRRAEEQHKLDIKQQTELHKAKLAKAKRPSGAK